MARINRTLLVLVVGAVVLAGADPTRARTPDFSCDDEHGMGTTLLCTDDYLLNGGYIKSPSEQYRMYMGTGNVVVYDMTDYDNPVFKYLVYDESNGPASELVFGSGLLLYDGANQVYAETAEGARSLRLDDNGCVGLYLEDGTLATFLVGAANSGCQ